MISAPAAPLVCLDMIVTVTVQCVYLDETYPQDVPPVCLDSLEVTVNLVSNWCLLIIISWSVVIATFLSCVVGIINRYNHYTGFCFRV